MLPCMWMVLGLIEDILSVLPREPTQTGLKN